MGGTSENNNEADLWKLTENFDWTQRTWEKIQMHVAEDSQGYFGENKNDQLVSSRSIVVQQYICILA